MLKWMEMCKGHQRIRLRRRRQRRGAIRDIGYPRSIVLSPDLTHREVSGRYPAILNDYTMCSVNAHLLLNLLRDLGIGLLQLESRLCREPVFHEVHQSFVQISLGEAQL